MPCAAYPTKHKKREVVLKILSDLKGLKGTSFLNTCLPPTVYLYRLIGASISGRAVR
jgi:hypothetical protein